MFKREKQGPEILSRSQRRFEAMARPCSMDGVGSREDSVAEVRHCGQ